MVNIERFKFQVCTAFRERQQLAEKINEIIDFINSGGDIYGELIAKVDALEETVNSLSAVIGEYDGTLSDVENAVNDIIDDISDIRTNVTDNTNDISNLKTRVTNTESNVSNLSQTVGSNTANITALTGRVTTAENEIGTLDTKITTNTGNITALTNRVSATENNVSNLTTRVSTNESNISGLDTRITANENNITSLSSQVTTNAGNLSTLTTQVNLNRQSIEILLSDARYKKVNFNDENFYRNAFLNNGILTKNLVVCFNIPDDPAGDTAAPGKGNFAGAAFFPSGLDISDATRNSLARSRSLVYVKNNVTYVATRFFEYRLSTLLNTTTNALPDHGVAEYSFQTQNNMIASYSDTSGIPTLREYFSVYYEV